MKTKTMFQPARIPFMRMIDHVYTERVAVDPDVCGGKPFIRGTGVSIAVILDALAQGLSAEEIVEHYPMLECEDIEAALAFATRLAERNGGVARVGRLSQAVLPHR